MTTVSLRVTGLEQVQTGFNKFAQTIGPVCREQTYAAIERATHKSPGWLGGASYTAPLPPSGDHRTGNLGASVQLEQDGLSSRVSVEAYSKEGYEYGKGVIGDAYGQGQSEYNQGRWVPIRQAVDEEIAAITVPGAGIDAGLAQSAKDSGL